MTTNKKERDFQTYLLEKISREDETVTITSESATHRRDDKHPRFEVWEYTPSNKFKKKQKELKRNEIHFSGPNWAIPIPASLAPATHDLLAQYLNLDIVFEEWFKKWKTGFPNLINRPHSQSQLTTNYSLRDTKEKSGWRTEKDKQPQYIEWKHPTEKIGYRVIEYFPKGISQPLNSIILTGSDWQIINQILTYEWQNNNSDLPSEINRETPLMGGHPQVILYFSGKTNLPGHSELTRMGLGFRLMNKVEHSDYAFQGETVLTEEDIKILTQKIQQKYINYSREKGDKTYSYTFKQQGYRLWSPLKDRTEAIRVFRDIVSLNGHSLREELIAESNKPIPCCY